MDKIKIVAEVGWNFLGDMKLAERMIVEAAKAGADCVKFQTWKVDRLVPGPWDSDGRREIYEKAELSSNDHYYLKSVCDSENVQFLTSCFSSKDLEFVRGLMNEVKIPSPESSNTDLVIRALSLFDHIYLSTGASAFSEWERWLSYDKITPLHCVSSYPCEPANFHYIKFDFIRRFCQKQGKDFGFSGHYPGIWDAVYAISRGASVIEKHFTVDHELPGRDNKFAILPHELASLREYADCVDQIKEPHSMYEALECEREYRKYHKGRWDGE